MEVAQTPLVSGADKRAGLFWFTISSLFIAPDEKTALPVSSQPARTDLRSHLGLV